MTNYALILSPKKRYGSHCKGRLEGGLLLMSFENRKKAVIVIMVREDVTRSMEFIAKDTFLILLRL